MAMQDVLNFLQQKRAAGTITHDEDNFLVGVTSGYPLCCVRNFMRLDTLGIPVGIVMDFIFGPDGDYHYVRCPKCRGYNVPPLDLKALSRKFQGIPFTIANHL